MKAHFAAFLLLTLAVVSTNAANEPIPASDVKRLIELAGQSAIVRGEVVRSTTSEKGSITFLNFSSIPHHGFAAVLFPRYREAFAHIDFPNLQGKTVTIYGVVTLYKGQPQIRLTDSAQIELSAGRSSQ